MRLAQAKGLGKIDIQDRKEPIALIDEGVKPRKSGAYFPDRRPKKMITTIAKWQVLRKPGG